MKPADGRALDEEVIRPGWIYILVPFGVLSFALYGLLILAPALVVTGYINKPDQVVASLQGDGLQLFLGLVVLWVLLVACCIGSSAMAARRRFFLGKGAITIKSAWGRNKSVSTRQVTDICILYSLAAIAPRLRLTYKDNTSRWLDGRGLSDATLEKVLTFMREGDS